MNIIFAKNARDDMDFWEKTNPKIHIKINQLIENIKISPFSGIGKPEPLKSVLTGYWSRRITHEHRLIYRIYEDVIYIAQARYHYK